MNIDFESRNITRRSFLKHLILLQKEDIMR